MTESFASITDFLTVRLYEDEHAARNAIADWPEDDDIALLPESLAVAVHVHRWRPRRVLREVEAKRRLIAHAFTEAEEVDGEWGCGHNAAQIRAGECEARQQGGLLMLQLLALPYVKHDGYKPEWAPDA